MKTFRERQREIERRGGREKEREREREGGEDDEGWRITIYARLGRAGVPPPLINRLLNLVGLCHRRRVTQIV